MKQRNNIIWLVYDSVREDHTSLTDYERDTTPAIHDIASKGAGAASPNCISHAIWSLPSTASMLTGTYPVYHNTGLKNDTLPQQIKTVPERLSAHGWRTVGLSANVYFSEETGLDRGFDRFVPIRIAPIRDSNLLSTAGPKALIKFLVNLRQHSGGFTLDTRKHNANYLVTEVAKKELKALFGGGEPFFFYAHFPGVHHPYVPPKPYRERFAADIDLSAAGAGRVALDRTTDIYEEIAAGCDYAPEEWEAIIAMYDACLAHVDDLVDALFEHIISHAAENTIVVITSDHGDLLGEHRLLGHKLVLHDALVNVPLIVHGFPDRLHLDDGLVQHSDVVNTILSLSDISTSGIDGIDLRHESRERAVSQRGDSTYRTTLERLTDLNPDFDATRFHAGLVTALRTEKFKLVDGKGRRVFYELPNENLDVTDDHPQAARDLEKHLEWWLAEHDTAITTSRDAAFSEGARQRLHELGYIVD